MNWGYESYILYKALQLGFEIEVFADIHTSVSRETTTNYNPKMFFNYGKAMQALGYSNLYTIGRCFVISKRKGIRSGLSMYKGYLDFQKTFSIRLYKTEKRKNK
jgi:hypothetical protein